MDALTVRAEQVGIFSTGQSGRASKATTQHPRPCRLTLQSFKQAQVLFTILATLEVN